MKPLHVTKEYFADGLHVRVWSNGKRTINGCPCGVSSLSDLELAACLGIRPMPPLDDVHAPDLYEQGWR